MKKQNILLDMDGVLSDFASAALDLLNRKYNKSYTIEQYAQDYGQFGIDKFYGISVEEFWRTIESEPHFWLNIKPFDWAGELVEKLREYGDVTIVTSPSEDPQCAAQKLEWLVTNLNIHVKDVFIGSKKYLMAGNGILIDDYKNNVSAFLNAGGDAILVPSNWNTLGLTKWDVFDTIEQTFKF